jgi:DNA-binding transcriptional ArsR family regulator
VKVSHRNGRTTSPRRELTVVDRDVQIKALANPERVRILTLLVERSGTAKQVADWIEGTRGRVHYHIKELEKAGLVEKVRTVEAGGVVEKYYRAVARNFYLARGIGEYEGLAGDVREMISRSMLGWRRREILEVDQNEIAQKVVRDCLGTKSGEIVVLKGDMVQRDIIKPLIRAVEAAGGSAITICTPGSLGNFLLKWKRRPEFGHRHRGAARLPHSERRGRSAEGRRRATPGVPEQSRPERAEVALRGDPGLSPRGPRRTRADRRGEAHHLSGIPDPAEGGRHGHRVPRPSRRMLDRARYRLPGTRAARRASERCPH